MELPVKNLLLSLGIASALMLAACGKKDEDAPVTQPQSTAPTATPPAGPTTTPADPAVTEEPADEPADQPAP
jgi:hypothetical protein